MLDWLRRVIDLLIPPHEDVLAARALSAKDVASLLAPREAGAPWIVALLPYHDARVRALIRAIKYYGEREALKTAGNILGEYLVQEISEKTLLDGWEQPLLIPVPSSQKRERERGYNQAARIASAALPIVGSAAEFSSNILFREDRLSQVRVARKARAENIQNAFFVPNKNSIAGRFVILIDDVVESGSTLKDARRALLAAGAKDIIAVALAH